MPERAATAVLPVARIALRRASGNRFPWRMKVLVKAGAGVAAAVPASVLAGAVPAHARGVPLVIESRVPW